MFKRLLVAVFSLFTFFAVAAPAQIPAASESDVWLPDKKDILDWMSQAAKIPAAQQNEKVGAALQGLVNSSSKTPRSDFQLCTGLAYLGNAKAQRCLGHAYEKAIGIVDDQLEAYAWFELAKSNGDAESVADAARILLRLNSAYPAPSEEELEKLVAEQKAKLAEYQKEAKK